MLCPAVDIVDLLYLSLSTLHWAKLATRDKENLA